MNPLSNNSSSNSHFDALLCITSQESRDVATGQLTTLGFEVHTVSDAQDAFTHLYSHSYNVVVVSEDFDGGDAETNPILAELATMPLNFRRSMFVILVGPNRIALSEMQAFSLSVDLVIRPQDILNLKALVGQGLARHEAFYEAYHSVAKQIRQEGQR